jgi:hypothetical protein
VSKAKFVILPAMMVLLSIVLAGCQFLSGQIPTIAAAEPEPTPTTVNYTGEFSLTPSVGLPGTPVTAAGSGFDANVELTIVWQGFRGSWKVEGADFNGREFKEEWNSLATVKTDASGHFEATFPVPDGFGFVHDVLVMKGSEVRNKAAFQVGMEASISPSTGTAGTPIAIELKGIGWRPLENSWMLIYDNKFTGWLSSVTSNGVARAIIPATGGPGKHIIQILHGSFTFPYMNMQQSPRPERPTWTFEFTVVDGAPVLPEPGAEQGLAIEPGTMPDGSAGPALWVEQASGPVGTPFALHGAGLPAGRALDILWYRVTGNRVSGEGWEEASTALGSVTVGADGQIELPLKALDDLGGAHRIEARAGEEKLAEAEFTITPSAFDIEPSSGPPGTPITIHLKGVGWTETANIYQLVYDNAYLGYACGFNSQGDVTVTLPAAGAPGWHFIDLYPGIYKGEDMGGVNNFRIPQLTFEDDHPGEQLPAFHFAFLVTE